MTAPTTLERKLLAQSEAVLARAVQETGTHGSGSRLDILEAVAAVGSDWDLESYRRVVPARRELDTTTAALWADKLIDCLNSQPIAVPLAVAALGRIDQDKGAQRRTGAYYTDFRLARYLADRIAAELPARARVLDPSVGSGVLLVALTLAAGRVGGASADEFVASSVCAADLSADSLRATTAALACAVRGLDAISALRERLVHGDSLLASADTWDRLAPEGFDTVIANPPWEKLKVTRHEVLAAAGVPRHYGAEYIDSDEDHRAYSAERQEMLAYLDELSPSTVMQGSGEADMYKLFLELSVRLLRPGGRLALLLPAGLIRSKGTEELRRFLITHTRELDIAVLENRRRFFAIDTRFKFLVLHAQTSAGGPGESLVLRHATGGDHAVAELGSVKISRREMSTFRPDLTVPEVRTPTEWDLYRRMANAGETMALGAWPHNYVREVDMTRDQHHFRRTSAKGHLPLLEGRAVHQFRYRAKAYRHGTGRAAVWRPLDIGQAETLPQFYFPVAKLPARVRDRANIARAGFCDVTGQTNERTLLATVIPPGVVCGNKVPTVTFKVPDVGSTDAAYLWVALLNSLPVDWLARRIVTTTVNYFLLRSVPLPKAGNHPETAQRILELAREITECEGSGEVDLWQIAEARSQIDSLVAELFGLTLADMELILDDFPLLDRGQPPIPGEGRATVTRDLVLARFAQRTGQDCTVWAHRLQAAQRVGSIAYVPSMAQLGTPSVSQRLTAAVSELLPSVESASDPARNEPSLG